ncbi:MAG: alpha/beta hydrolase [Aggregatilineales bacterium]
MQKKLFWILICLLMPLLALNAQDDTDLSPQELADPDSAFVDINGVEIYYVEQGDPQNPTVLLLHGFGGSTFTWRDNISVIADAGYHVIAFDRPPYGLADKDPDALDYTPQAYAELTAGLMDALDISSATLVGHSAGGTVIAEFAVQFRERADALVFVAGAVRIPQEDAPSSDSTPEPDSGGSPLGSLGTIAANLDPNSPLAAGIIRNFVTPDVFIDILSSAYGSDFVVTDEVASGYQRALRVDGWELAFLALFANQNVPTPPDFEALARFEAPILIQWGEADTWVPLSAGESLHEFFSGSTFITYPEIGHLPMEETVDAFNADLITFLDAVYRN